jgi:pimeloyl-ACP methyl ester carboxylesterase
MASSSDTGDLGEDGFVDSGGVKIHYITKGAGPLVVLIHGIPGFWYDWRHQIPALAEHFRVVAIDQRGFNLSDQPEGVENYAIDKLVGDVDAVVQHFGQQKAIIVGHDSGGWISWHYAMAHPDKTDRLVIVNLPIPRASSASWRTTPGSTRPVTTHGKSSNCRRAAEPWSTRAARTC